jgi:UDP-N-acetylmuramyl pentapeptide phosphotransferase/UDP-N-acetylglucosamine-1-phosphate transferase
MFPLLFSAISGFLISMAVLPLIIRYAQKKKLFVELDQRKIHKRITPSMGGIAIFSGLCVSSMIWSNATISPEVLLVLSVLSIPFFIGFLDDRFHLKPLQKICGQLIAATLVFILLDVKVSSLYGLFDSSYIFPGWLSYLVTVVTIVLLTNSFNLIDGIDGLAGTFSLVALSFFGIWFSIVQVDLYAMISFALAGSVIAFLFKNWQPSKIFMGDTGSLVLGMSLSILAIEFVNQNQQISIHHAMKFHSGIGTILCVMIVPIVDTIRVIIIRVSRGLSPLAADKRHIHHALVRIGKSHRFAVLLIFVVHLFFIANALLLKDFSDWYVIGSVGLFSGLLCYILDKVVARHTYSRKSADAAIPLKGTETVNF